jgi:hypothetical protein
MQNNRIRRTGCRNPYCELLMVGSAEVECSDANLTRGFIGMLRDLAAWLVLHRLGVVGLKTGHYISVPAQVMISCCRELAEA